MANEQLRTAMKRAGMNAADLGSRVGVDPKTVDRWLAGRLPHRRHRWVVAGVLGCDEAALWPGERVATELGATPDLVAAYPVRSLLEPSAWRRLIDGSQEQVDLLGYTLYFLHDQHADLVALLRSRAESGCRVRILLADPASEHVRQRDDEEQLAVTLTARIRTSLHLFEPLQSVADIELRLQDAPLYNSVYRFDDQMLVTPHLYATPGSQAPLLHLRHLASGSLFDRFAANADLLWSASTPAWPAKRSGVDSAAS